MSEKQQIQYRWYRFLRNRRVCQTRNPGSVHGRSALLEVDQICDAELLELLDLIYLDQ